MLAARDETSPQARVALEKLCKVYWPPLYAFVRHSGYSREDAQDLVQEFFAKFLEKNWLQHLQHQRGKFRSFLLTLLKHFLLDQKDKTSAQKRGGSKTIISFDSCDPEERYALEPSDGLAPEQIYERQWALALLDQTARRLQEEYRHTGNEPLFIRLKDLQPGARGTSTYAQIAAELGITEGALKTAVHRLRRRHSEILREEIARTLSSPDEINDEIRHLINILG